MLHLVGGCPMLEVAIDCPLTGRRYPEQGVGLALLDTGYEGFVLVPRDVFDSVFEGLEPEERTLILATGKPVRSLGTYGRVLLQDEGVELEGFVETFEGVEEIVVGLEFAREFRLTLDYCAGLGFLELCTILHP